MVRSQRIIWGAVDDKPAEADGTASLEGVFPWQKFSRLLRPAAL
jgi:hypothetical protein